MDTIFTSRFVDYEKTGLFSTIILDYLAYDEKLVDFYIHRPILESFAEVISLRKNTKTNRTILKNVLLEQYNRITEKDRGESVKIIQSLENENTFTVTTGHQLCIFTGPLYFIYKIVSTIRLAEKLKEAYPENNFIPVYWMATEDHDFEEVNHIHVFSKKITWQQDQKGAAGCISTVTLGSFLLELKEVLGNSENAKYLISLFEKSYIENNNLADSTRFLVHHLLGKYGLIILDPDVPELKAEFSAIMEDDLLNQNAFQLVNQTTQKLSEHYKTQVVPREINLFFLTANSRERIIRTDDNTYKINNTTLSYTKHQILDLLRDHPEYFSPNVILRPLYQEAILPDLAYVGGPGEIAYWLQYKDLFGFYKIPFPVLVMRNSILFLGKEELKKLSEFHFSEEEIFFDSDTLTKRYLKNNGSDSENPDFNTEKEELNVIYEKLKKYAEISDSTLIPFVTGEQQKALHAIQILEQKIMKSEKRKHEVTINQLKALKEKLFPANSPQERHYNFSMFYLKYGEEFFRYLMKETDPLRLQYQIIKEEENK